MVGQSVMHASVILSPLGGPPHSCGALLREGSPSLNPHLTHWMVHQSYSNRMGVIYGDLFIFLIFVFPSCLVGAIGRLRRCCVGILCEVHGLDLLQSLEHAERLLCGKDLLCGVSRQ